MFLRPNITYTTAQPIVQVNATPTPGTTVYNSNGTVTITMTYQEYQGYTNWKNGQTSMTSSVPTAPMMTHMYQPTAPTAPMAFPPQPQQPQQQPIKIMDCLCCNKKGSNSFGDVCTICQGFGCVLVFWQDGKCSKCNGKCRGSFGDACVQCRGNGYTRIALESEASNMMKWENVICRRCDGKQVYGSWNTPCKCNGKRITAPSPAHLCARCHGKAVNTFGDECMVCKATGWAYSNYC